MSGYNEAYFFFDRETLSAPPIFTMAAALASLATLPLQRAFPFASARRNLGPARNSIALANRHGGPHEHRREIARRQRQAAARAA